MDGWTNGLTSLPTNRSFVLFYPHPKAAANHEVRQCEIDPDTHAYKIIVGFFLTIVIQTRGFARKKIFFGPFCHVKEEKNSDLVETTLDFFVTTSVGVFDKEPGKSSEFSRFVVVSPPTLVADTHPHRTTHPPTDRQQPLLTNDTFGWSSKGRQEHQQQQQQQQQQSPVRLQQQQQQQHQRLYP